MAYFSMTRMALKWALRRPPTRRYPFVARDPIPLSRGQLVFLKDACTYCTVCGKKCPTKAIAVSRAKKRWTIDRLMCISCGYCVEVCPKKCLSLSTAHGQPAVTKDREVHQAGSVTG
jgi:ech hydrogenase subunit F